MARRIRTKEYKKIGYSVTWHGPEVGKMSTQAVRATLFMMGHVLRGRIERVLRSKPGVVSAPGRTPGMHTGRLADSWNVIRTSTGAMVYSDEPVSRWLEFGTVKMAPRPYIRPELDSLRSAMDEALSINRFP